MNHEQLKVIAEGIGYEAKATTFRCSIKTFPYAYAPNLPKWVLYDPRKNDSRLVELLIKLIDSGWCIPKRKNSLTYTLGAYSKTIYEVEGKTFSEAVCNAGFFHFSHLNNISKL